MRIGYWLGMLLLILAAGVLLAQAISLVVEGGYRPIGLGSLWYQVHSGSLVGFQALIEKSVSPAAWPPVLWLLGLPAWLLPGMLGAVLLLSGRQRRRGFD